MRRIAALSFIIVVIPSCDRHDGKPGRDSLAPAASAENSSVVPSALISPTAGGSDIASESAPSVVVASAASMLIGPWEGVADAKRVAIDLPASTPWPAWRKDDGKQSGPVSISVEIDRTGEVRGKATGVLGALNVVGRIESQTLRAAISPLDPAADDAMTGTLLGAADGERITARLSASSRTGHRVRGAVFELKPSVARPPK